MPVCVGLKVQCHEIFCFRFFSWITFPQAPDNNIRIISNFFENSRRYSQVKVNDTHRWQICHRYQRHRRQIFPPISLVLLTPVSTIPAANLPPVAICRWYQWQRRQICHRCHWHRCQIMGIISGCRHLKVNLKTKIYIYVSSTTTQRWPNKIIKIFLIEDSFHLPPVSLTPVANLELRISPRIFEKIRNGLNGILWGWGGNWFMKRTRNKKSRDTVPLIMVSCLFLSVLLITSGL